MSSQPSAEFTPGHNLLAAVFAGSEQGFHLKSVPVPMLAPGELLLKVAAVGICGTDLKIFAGRKQPRPLPSGDVILGHEVVGEVVLSSDQPGAPCRGQRVVVEPDIYCGACRYCAAGATNMCPDTKVIFEDYPGAFAQFLVVPAKAVENGQVHVLPEHLSAEEGTLVEPLSCVVHGQERLLRVLPLRDSALIIGGGPIGTMHALLARANGFKHVVIADANRNRVELLRRLLTGYSDIECIEIAAQGQLAELGERQFDMVVQACPDATALQDGLARVAPSGGVLAFAGVAKGDSIRVDVHRLHYKDLHIIGSANYLGSDIRKAIALLATGAVPGSLLISQRFPLADIQNAMRFGQSGNGLKLVINPN